MMSDRLLSEVERQEKYLSRLPSDFKFPLFNAKQALESQRASAYRSTAAASREIIDNAIEAGADRIHVVFDTERSANGSRRLVDAVAFIDNGAGMLPQMARYALTWGGGTHFDDPSGIGRFGFGLPNASINQSKRVEVYSRTSSTTEFACAFLDITEFSTWGIQEVPEAKPAKLPRFVQSYLERTGLTLDHGAVVVWVNPDRLSYRTAAPLKEHMADDFGVTYRYLLAKPEHLELVVDGRQIEAVDPLFVLPEARYYLSPEEGGAIVMDEALLPVAKMRDPETGEQHWKLLTDAIEIEEESPNIISKHTFEVRVVRFPIGFAVDKGRRKIETTDAHRRFDIRKSRRGMAFVRSEREIQTVDVFPRARSEESKGMGQWPLLQSYAYHWGCEVRFDPDLDELFGITNDKQGVRPSEDLWRILTDAEIDQALRRENRWQSDQRAKLPPAPEPVTGATPAESSAQAADLALGERPRVPDHLKKEVRERLEQEAVAQVGVLGATKEEVLEALEAEARRRSYRIEYVHERRGPFYEPDWFGSQVLIRINQDHPFYQVLYGDILRLPGGSRAKEAIDLLLITLAKAELTAENDETLELYRMQRETRWSPFLQTALRTLTKRVALDEEAADSETETDVAADAAAAVDASADLVTAA